MAIYMYKDRLEGTVVAFQNSATKLVHIKTYMLSNTTA
jgi:hypothetical protein